MSFLNELKRRSIFKVGATYAVLAWLLIQIIDTVLQTFGAPEWKMQTIMFVILLGFPVWLVLAWIFEISSSGIKTQQQVDDPEFQAGQNFTQ
jgi:adenylate cyclase